MADIITEIAALIGKPKVEELKRKMMALVSRPIPKKEYVVPEAAETADVLLHYYVALRAKQQLSKGQKSDDVNEAYTEQVFLVASKLLAVAINGFDELKPELVFLGKKALQ